MRVRRAAITGASGFIGWHLAERLRDAGGEVLAIVRPESRGETPPGVERVAVPFLAADLARAFRGADVVFHLAGRTGAATRGAFDDANVRVTREVALAARDSGARMVHVSSQAAAGPAGLDHPRTEEDPPRPCSDYGASKLAGERVVEATEGLAWTIVRPVAVYGPRDRAFLPLFRLARAGVSPIMGDPAACYMLIHVADLVAALEEAALRDAAIRGTFFVGHPAPHRADAVLATIAAAVGRPSRFVPVPRALLRAAAAWGAVAAAVGARPLLDRSKLDELSAGGFVCDVTRAGRVLGTSPRTDIAEGFAATAAWYRGHGQLRA